MNIKNQEKWEKYRKGAFNSLKQFNGELIFRGSMNNILTGQYDYKLTVIIKFPTKESADAWYTSSAYQKLIPIREEAADMVLASFETL